MSSNLPASCKKIVLGGCQAKPTTTMGGVGRRVAAPPMIRASPPEQQNHFVWQAMYTLGRPVNEHYLCTLLAIYTIFMVILWKRYA